MERGPRSAEVHQELATIHVALGDIEGGLRLLEEAVSLEPLGFLVLFSAGYTQFHVGNHERAVPLLKRAIEVVPSHPFPRRILAEVYYELGQEADALDALIGVGFPPEAEGAIREAYGQRGMLGAFSVFHGLEQASSGLECTFDQSFGTHLLVLLERYEEALRCIGEQIERRTLDIGGFHKVDTHLDPLRDDPRFQAALEKMGLAD